MFNIHFVKILFSFVGIIAVGLLVLAAAGYYEFRNQENYAGQIRQSASPR